MLGFRKNIQIKGPLRKKKNSWSIIILNVLIMWFLINIAIKILKLINNSSSLNKGNCNRIWFGCLIFISIDFTMKFFHFLLGFSLDCEDISNTKNSVSLVTFLNTLKFVKSTVICLVWKPGQTWSCNCYTLYYIIHAQT